MKNKIKNKKSQVASTMTWFGAFIIIFFIMLIFIFFAGAISLKNQGVAGILKSVYGDTPYSSDYGKSLIFIKNSYIQDVFQERIRVNGQEVNLDTLFREYDGSKARKADIRCLFQRITGEELIFGGGYYPSIEFDGFQVQPAKSRDCEENTGVNILKPKKNGAINVEFKFLVCDDTLEKQSFSNTWFGKFRLKRSIASAERDNALFAYECLSVEEAKNILKDFENQNFENFMKAIARTDAENKIIESILNDKLSIRVGSISYIYDNAGLWRDEFMPDVTTDIETMRKILAGFEDETQIPDLSNAKKEGGVWIVPLKPKS